MPARKSQADKDFDLLESNFLKFLGFEVGSVSITVIATSLLIQLFGYNLATLHQSPFWFGPAGGLIRFIFLPLSVISCIIFTKELRIPAKFVLFYSIFSILIGMQILLSLPT